jgi:creatinine amidohydrolase/Fe(II)-dependent formamide hydrolase-like protein
MVNNLSNETLYILAETNWKNIKEQKFEVALLPWSATEAHNYHLPNDSDNILTEKLLSNLLAWHGNERQKSLY